jgi:ribosomal RNA-processing protein 12
VLSAVVLLLQVCAMRMPVDMLLQWLPQMMEGMLIWSDDSKNKFRLKVGAALWKHRLQ